MYSYFRNYCPQQKWVNFRYHNFIVFDNNIILTKRFILIYYYRILYNTVSSNETWKYLSIYNLHSTLYSRDTTDTTNTYIFIYLLSNIYFIKMVIWDTLSRSLFMAIFLILDSGRSEKNIMIFTMMCHVCFIFQYIINFWGRSINAHIFDFSNFFVRTINPSDTLGIISSQWFLKASGRTKNNYNFSNLIFYFCLELIQNL